MGRKVNVKTTSQVEIWCPLCGSKFKLNRIKRHLNRRHLGISKKALKELIEQGMSDGTLRYQVRLFDGVTKTRSGTQTLYLSNNTKAGKPRFVSGGAFELGKRR